MAVRGGLREPTNHHRQRHSSDRRLPAAPAGITRPKLQSGASCVRSQAPAACKSGHGSTVSPPVTLGAHNPASFTTTLSGHCFRSAPIDTPPACPPEYFPKRSLCIRVSGKKANRCHRITRRRSRPPRRLPKQPAYRRLSDVHVTRVLAQDTALTVFQHGSRGSANGIREAAERNRRGFDCDNEPRRFALQFQLPPKS